MFVKSVRRLFYSHSSEIINDIVKLHSCDATPTPRWFNGKRLNLFSTIYLSVAIFLTARMAAYTLVLIISANFPNYAHLAPTYFSIELNSGLFNKFLPNDQLVGLLMTPYCVNTIAILAITLLAPNAPLWFLVNDYLVNNGAQFWNSNPQLKFSLSDVLKSPSDTIKKILNILKQMWWTSMTSGGQRGVNFQNRLSYLLNYSTNTRSRTLLLHLFMEIVFFFVQIIAGKVFKI